MTQVTQQKKVSSMESRIDRVELEQDHLRGSVEKLIVSQENQTAEMSKNTAAVMIMCHKLDSSTEIGKKALDRVDALSIRINTIETKDSERLRMEKTQFVGMMVLAVSSIAAVLKAFGAI